MSDLSYTIAILMIVLWLLGYFVFSVGAIIHLLLIAAVIVFWFKLLKRRKSTNN